MTNHHTAQILAFLIHDVANLQRELQICRNALSKCPFFNVYSTYDMLKGESSSVVHRRDLRNFLSKKKEDFPIMQEFSALWLNICDSDGILSFNTFQSWFPCASSSHRVGNQSQLISAVAKLFTKHAQCYRQMKNLVRKRLVGLDFNTFQLVDRNADGFLSRDDIEKFLSSHNIDLKRSSFDIPGKLFEFFRVTPFSGGITFKMWTRLFHSTHDSLRFLSSPARTVRGSLTPRRGIHTTTHMTPVRRPLSGSTFRMAFTPVATRQRTSTHMTPSASQKSSHGSRTPVNHGRHTSRSSKKLLARQQSSENIQSGRHRRNVSNGTNETSGTGNDGSTNPSGGPSSCCDFDDYGLLDSQKLSASRSRVDLFKSISDSHRWKRSQSVRRRSRKRSFSEDPLKKFSFSHSHTSSLLISKHHRSTRKHAFPKTTYSMLFSKNSDFEDEKTQDDDDVDFDAKIKETPVTQEKLLRLSDLESSPLEGDFSDYAFQENLDESMSCEEFF